VLEGEVCNISTSNLSTTATIAAYNFLELDLHFKEKKLQSNSNLPELSMFEKLRLESNNGEGSVEELSLKSIISSKIPAKDVNTIIPEGSLRSFVKHH